MTRRAPPLAVAILAALAVATGAAQRFGVPEGPWVPPRFPPPDFHDGGFTHCKVMYTSVRREANGMGWATDYPYAAINLLTRVQELTKTRVSMTPTASRTTGWCGSPTRRSSRARSPWPPMSARSSSTTPR